MGATDVTETLDEAIAIIGVDQIKVLMSTSEDSMRC